MARDVNGRESRERSYGWGQEDDPDLEVFRPHVAPGKLTLSSRLPTPSVVVVQRRESTGTAVVDPEDVRRIATEGTSGGGGRLPHLEAIQQAFGSHDVSRIEAHVGGEAGVAAEQIGAEAYAMGNHVVFRGTPDLHTAAHEAAHVVQQRAGVQLEGGVGKRGDAYEHQADAVADRVVAGESAEDLLDGITPGAASVQQLAVQKEETEADDDAAARGQLKGRHEAINKPLLELKGKVFDLLGIVERSEGQAVNPDVNALDTETHNLWREFVELRIGLDKIPVGELETRIAAIEAALPMLQKEMEKYEPYLAYHKSLQLDELKIVAKLLEPLQLETDDAVRILNEKKQAVERAKASVDNQRVVTQVNLALNMIGLALNLDPTGIVSGGYTAVLMAMNGPSLDGAGGMASGAGGLGGHLAGKFGGHVGKAGAVVSHCASGVGIIASTYGTIDTMLKDKNKYDQLLQKLQTALQEVQSATMQVNTLMVTLMTELNKAESLAARANSAYRNYKTGF